MKNPATNLWDEIEDNQLIESFELQTYDSNSLVLYSEFSGQYVELKDGQSKSVFGEIEYLDISETGDESIGYWMITDRVDRKITLFVFFCLFINIIF